MKKFFVVAAICIALMATTYFSACNNNKSEPKATDNRDSIKKVLAIASRIMANTRARLFPELKVGEDMRLLPVLVFPELCSDATLLQIQKQVLATGQMTKF
jgi:ribosome-binding factor A